MILNVKDIDGNELQIPYSEVSKIRSHGEILFLEHYGVEYAGPFVRYIELETPNGSHKIARSPDNDTEILDLLFSKRSSAA